LIPENLKFGGGVSQSTVHPAVVVAMLIAIVLTLLLPRKYAVLPLLLMAFLVPMGQQFVLGGLHVFVLRIVILAGLARMMISGGALRTRLAGGFGKLDKLLVLWAFFHALSFILLFRELAAVTNQVGVVWDSLGAFFVLRFLIRDSQDIERIIKTLAGIAAVLAVCMLNEHFHHVNVFGYLGGVPIVPEMREGALRAQGPFSHPLLAGAFGAVLWPLFFWLWIGGRSKVLSAVGILSSGIIAVMSASSTPVMAVAAGLFGLLFWHARRHLRLCLWGLVVVLVSLQAVMKAPVWFLIARVDLVGGSSGYHRAMLIDQFIRNFFDWWLVGTNNNGNWGWDMWDTCNQFVQEGETGGLAALVCFVAIIVVCFRKLGNARRAAKGNRRKQWFLWLLGVTLFTQTVAFFGISYFDQTRVLWFALLAIIVAATVPVRAKKIPLAEPPAEVTPAGAEFAHALPESGSISQALLNLPGRVG
jgi:hypothetical protein